ncbi:hypothetical protein KQ944_15830 [Bacillus subtilis]|uniref:hypothetical protein n=1 Tax=Pseudochrobactrum asaccharolyticum TaxID=354351 RepID=UPI001F1DBCC6|nr:hypothetical protein [Pseudochrobactrum asaccharolyticum]MCF7646699.1 hypothetical protein [Pseudochrobactrum asaccharolyticum]MCF7673105.1 hypothetical protein [Bacillus subtilis]
MPSFEEIQYYFSAVWRTMTGHPEALNNLNTDADGFWRSFYAILIALPPMLIGWVEIAARLTDGDETALRLINTVKLATIDMIVWLLPLLIIGFLSRSLGLERRFSTYVVATNWATALFAWIYAPLSFLNLLLPDLSPVFAGIGFGLFLATLALSYRLTRAALQRPHSFAAPFFISVILGSIMLTIILQGLTGLIPAS